MESARAHINIKKGEVPAPDTTEIKRGDSLVIIVEEGRTGI
jgi:hypothetical protein